MTMIGMIRRRSGGTKAKIDYTKVPLTFTALEASTITRTGTYASNLQYSIDGGANWNTFDGNVTISLATGESAIFKGTNNRLGTSTSDFTQFVMTGSIEAVGNIMSLLYGDNFIGQLSLPNYTYSLCGLFLNCTALTSAPEFPATTLREGCYHSTFKGCTNLISGPTKLPATKAIGRCYYSMFHGCSSLVNAPSIGLTQDSNGGNSYSCYSMFQSCTSLITAPEILITGTIKYYSLQNMFSGCSSLETPPPHLYATTLQFRSYDSMFSGCTKLKKAPIIHATSVGQNGMSSMFYGCTSLTDVQDEFPTVSGNGGMSNCFAGCTSLTKSPTLPTLTLNATYYQQLFDGATNLNYVKALFTTKSGSQPIGNWMRGVQNVSGIFVKHINATWTDTGANGVPTNWTIIYYDPTDDKYYTDQTKATECDEHGNPII